MNWHRVLRRKAVGIPDISNTVRRSAENNLFLFKHLLLILVRAPIIPFSAKLICSIIVCMLCKSNLYYLSNNLNCSDK